MSSQLETATPAPVAIAGQQAMVDILNLIPNPWQPRRHFDLAKLAELAEDIRLNGLLQPVVVRPAAGSGKYYQIAAGERRWRAFQMLVAGYEISGPAEEGDDGQLVPGQGDPGDVGITLKAKSDARFSQIPVLVRDLSDEEMMRVALSENEKRKDVSAMEEALAFRQMMEDLGVTQSEFARRFGISQPTVANRVRMLALPESIHHYFVEGKLGQSHAIELLKVQAAGEGKDEVGSRWIEMLAEALIAGRLSMQDLSAGRWFWNASNIWEGAIIDLRRSGTKFDPDIICKGCQFYFAEKSQWNASKYCANPALFHEKNSKLQAELLQKEEKSLAISKEKAVKEYGRDLLRTPEGKAVQKKAEFDEQGVPVIERAYGVLEYNEYKTFGGYDYNGFDTTACLKCEFYAKVVEHGSGGSRYICVNPKHFLQLHRAHARVLAAQAKAEADEKIKEFRRYSSNLLLIRMAYLDRATAEMVAKFLMCSVSDYEKDKIKPIQEWLEAQKLSPRLVKFPGGYYSHATGWVDDELARMDELGDDNYNQVVTKAVACLVESHLMATKGKEEGIPKVVLNYYQQVMKALAEEERRFPSVANAEVAEEAGVA